MTESFYMKRARKSSIHKFVSERDYEGFVVELAAEFEAMSKEAITPDRCECERCVKAREVTA